MTPHTPRPATPAIAAENARLTQTLPFHDTQDFEDARRGFIAALEPCVITAEDGRVVWDNDSYAFLTGDAPDTVNPSLWRISTLNAMQGLFEVVPGIYQVRGFDLSNITFVEGETGVVVIDPLISMETAAAALALYREHRGDRPVTGVIYSHSHADHFGGVRGVVSQEDVDSGRVPVIAPAGFTGHAISENVYAGVAMARRAGYMYGAALPRGPQGQVGAGLAQTTSVGTVTLIAPTLEITTTGEEHVVDGLRIVFQMAPGSEAPAEMHFHFPDLRALASPRTPRTSSTTSSRSEVPWCATRTRGRATSPRRWTSSAPTPTSCSPRTTGPPGTRTGPWSSSGSRATSMPTSTTRHCGCSTRA